MIATNYGNLYAFVYGLPLLLFALLLFIFGSRFRPARFIAGIFASLAAVILFGSLPDAKGGDYDLTLGGAWISVLLGFVSFLFAIVIPSRNRPEPKK